MSPVPPPAQARARPALLWGPNGDPPSPDWPLFPLPLTWRLDRTRSPAGPSGPEECWGGHVGVTHGVWWQTGIWHGAPGVSPAGKTGRTDGNHWACPSSPPSSLPACPPQVPTVDLLSPLPETRPGTQTLRVRCTPHTHRPGAAGSGGRSPRRAESSRRTLADLHRPLRPGHEQQQTNTTAPLTQAESEFDVPLLGHGVGRGDLTARLEAVGDGRTVQSFHSCSPCTSHWSRNW